MIVLDRSREKVFVEKQFTHLCVVTRRDGRTFIALEGSLYRSVTSPVLYGKREELLRTVGSVLLAKLPCLEEWKIPFAERFNGTLFTLRETERGRYFLVPKWELEKVLLRLRIRDTEGLKASLEALTKEIFPEFESFIKSL